MSSHVRCQFWRNWWPVLSVVSCDVSSGSREHSGCGFSQGETTLYHNVFSHWLNPYPEWSLWRHPLIRRRVYPYLRTAWWHHYAEKFSAFPPQKDSNARALVHSLLFAWWSCWTTTWATRVLRYHLFSGNYVCGFGRIELEFSIITFTLCVPCHLNCDISMYTNPNAKRTKVLLVDAWYPFLWYIC